MGRVQFKPRVEKYIQFGEMEKTFEEGQNEILEQNSHLCVWICMITGQYYWATAYMVSRKSITRSWVGSAMKPTYNHKA